MVSIQRPYLFVEDGKPVTLVCISTGFPDARDCGFIIPIPMRMAEANNSGND
jgi:hypothetical protein